MHHCFPGSSDGKESTCNEETWVRSLGWEEPLEKGMATHSSILPGELHGLYSPRGHKELDMTETFTYTSLKVSQFKTAQFDFLTSYGLNLLLSLQTINMIILSFPDSC